MALTPMMSQYLEVKEQNKDCILFYRLGDFYEMFFEDAIKVSGLLGLTLTGRDCGRKERAPMCGVPYHAADVYISKLVALGEKVAICEQLTAPKAKGLVERDVVKIVTAGTITNNDLIDDKRNNFISSIYLENGTISLAWADITTGEFIVRLFDKENAIEELFDTLARVMPAEIIVNKSAYERLVDTPNVRNGIIPIPNLFTESCYALSNARSVLEGQFNTLSLQAFGIENDKACICSAGALVSYLKETQKHSLVNINSITKENASDIMMLDANAIRNLELTSTIKDGKRYGSLLWLLDKTKTSMGARKLQNWILSPLNSIEKINYRLNGVAGLYSNTLIRQNLSNLLSSVKDIARLSGKVSNGNLTPKDCVALRKSLEVLPSVKFQLLGFDVQILKDVSDGLIDFGETTKLLSSAINEDAPVNTKDGGYIKEGFDPELDELRSLSKDGKGCILAIENRERERTGIKNLKIGYNKVFGYFIEITNSFKDRAPYDYKRRQTLANAERYITDELKELEYKLLSSEEKALQIESRIFTQIKEHLLGKINELKIVSDKLAELDVLLSLSVVARENSFVQPEMLESNRKLNVIDGRHPVVEAISKQRFVPNDCILDNNENRTMIITGPNMAGKSTYMRQIALITIMAHIGSFVPARRAEIPLVDKIFTRIGASDNLISDQSTFMVEMMEVANIIRNSTEKSLLILDEVGRGTSTYDGLSIAWSVVEWITEKIRAKTLFATHYHELTELEGVLYGVKNYKVTVKEMPDGIIFLRKIMRGGTNRSFGIEVAELAGVDRALTKRARDILCNLEKNDVSCTKKSISNENNIINLSEAERIISDINVDNLSPMQAFNILVDLKDKIDKK